MSRSARVLIVGPPGAGRTTLACRLVEVATRGKDAFATLLPVEEELALRGLRREEPEARPGSRTTRQALDKVLRDGDVAAASPEDERLLLATSSGGKVELQDVAGAHYANDSLAQDAMSALRALEREADAFVLVLDAKTWCDPAGVREVERDRAAGLVRRLASAARERKRTIPCALVLARWDLAGATAPPQAFEELASLADRETGVRAQRLWLDRALEPALVGLARWLVALAPERRTHRAPVVAAIVAALLLVAFFVRGAIAWRALVAAPPRFSAEEERAFLERADETLSSVWLVPFPKGGARDVVSEHARNLETLLRREHPAVWEPTATVGLQPAQYVSAAQALALVDRHLGATKERAAIEAVLAAKARVAEMPPARPDTLPAWEELWKTTPDRVVRDSVIAPRIRTVLAFLFREAERAADERDWPALLEPVRAVERAHVPVAKDLSDSSQERQWTRAFGLLFSSGGADAASVVSVIATAPEVPPASFLRRAGRLVGDAQLANPAPTPKLDELLGAEGARGMLAAIAPAYSAMTALAREHGPARLAAITSAVALFPRAALPPADRERLERFEAHLRELGTPRGYGLRVTRALVSPRFDAFYDAFDLTVVGSSEETPEKKLGPFANQREVALDEPLFAPGELIWKAWDRLEVRVVDDTRTSAGIARRDSGSCFGLRKFMGEWREPSGDGLLDIEVSPAPPAPFDFRGWPDERGRP